MLRQESPQRIDDILPPDARSGDDPPRSQRGSAAGTRTHPERGRRKKNDCERNAAKRLLDDLRRDHPRLKAIIIEDAPASNAPHITYLKNKGFRYILGAKPGDHKLLFSRFEASESKKSWKTRDKKTGTVQHFE